MEQTYAASVPARTADPPIGILLSNLGTPDAPTARAVRRYLAEFLSDPRVVDMPRWLWWPVLHGVILRLRPRRSAAAYARIWSDRGSPLLAISKRQAGALQAELDTRWPGRTRVALGMRYGKPSLRQALESLRTAGVHKLLVLPVYPQYSATTTASTLDAVATLLGAWQPQPALRLVRHYHDHPAYVAALAASVRETWEAHGRAERLLFSFHGIPKRYCDAGDPYFGECHATARLLAEHLDLDTHAWRVAFQSRFGPEAWLAPYTDEVLREWGHAGVGHVQILCPGFAADCLETLEECALRYRETFEAAGGQSLHYIPALNDRPDHVAMFAALVGEKLRVWASND